MKFIYLISLPNSGSTVISLLANVHKDLVSPGEMCGPRGGPGNERKPFCSCGNLIADCPFWGKVGERYRAKGFPWQPKYWGLDYEHEVAGYSRCIRPFMARFDVLGKSIPFMEGLPFLGSKIKDIHQRNYEFADVVQKESGCKVILDASKSYTRFLFLNRIPDIDLYAVHLVRDPRGWCNSRKKNNGIAVKDGAAFWVRQNNVIEQVVSSLATEKRLLLRYEDFCSNPQSTMSDIFKMVGLPQVSLPEDINSIRHHLLGNRMRTDRDIKIKEDLSWHKQLTGEEISRINDITVAASNYYGYTL